MAYIYFIRGVSGVGKTTLARELAEKYDMVLVEADQFFARGGKYNFRPALLGKAHDWARKKLEAAVTAGKSVVVSNTSTRIKEVTQYLDFIDPNTTIVVVDLLRDGARAGYKNAHGVPDDKVALQAERFESFPASIRKGETLKNAMPLPDGKISKIESAESYVIWGGEK